MSTTIPFIFGRKSEATSRRILLRLPFNEDVLEQRLTYDLPLFIPLNEWGTNSNGEDLYIGRPSDGRTFPTPVLLLTNRFEELTNHGAVKVIHASLTMIKDMNVQDWKYYPPTKPVESLSCNRSTQTESEYFQSTTTTSNTIETETVRLLDAQMNAENRARSMTTTESEDFVYECYRRPLLSVIARMSLFLSCKPTRTQWTLADFRNEVRSHFIRFYSEELSYLRINCSLTYPTWADLIERMYLIHSKYECNIFNQTSEHRCNYGTCLLQWLSLPVIDEIGTGPPEPFLFLYFLKYVKSTYLDADQERVFDLIDDFFRKGSYYADVKFADAYKTIKDTTLSDENLIQRFYQIMESFISDEPVQELAQEENLISDFEYSD